jgi:hypothetical protein
MIRLWRQQPDQARGRHVYPALRAASSPQEMVQLAGHFNELQNQQFGPDVFPRMLGRVVAVHPATDHGIRASPGRKVRASRPGSPSIRP